jgi:hypothetical protein
VSYFDVLAWSTSFEIVVNSKCRATIAGAIFAANDVKGVADVGQCAVVLRIVRKDASTLSHRLLKLLGRTHSP